MSYNCPLRAFCNGLCRVAPPKRGIFWRFQVHVYERVGISPVEVCDLKGLGNLSSRYNVKGLKMAYKRVLWLGKKVQRILDFSKKKMFARQPGFHNFRALSSFHRAANNGRSTDNVRSKLGTDRTNPWIAGHLVRSFTDSFKEILIFTCLIITSDNSHVSERKKKRI